MKIGDKVRVKHHAAQEYGITDQTIGEVSRFDERLVYVTFLHMRDLCFFHTEDIVPVLPQQTQMAEELPQPAQSSRLNAGKIQSRELNPEFIMAMAEVLTKSRSKYAAFNWTLLTKLSTPYESLFRHLMAFQSGEDYDPDDGCHHMVKVAINAMFIHYHNVNNKEESDDRFFKKERK